MRNRARQRENRKKKAVTKCHRSTCAGCKDGVCRILKSTHFGEKACPFFKTKEQNDKECAAVMARLIAQDRHDLIDLYYGGGSNGC